MRDRTGFSKESGPFINDPDEKSDPEWVLRSPTFVLRVIRAGLGITLTVGACWLIHLGNRVENGLHTGYSLDGMMLLPIALVVLAGWRLALIPVAALLLNWPPISTGYRAFLAAGLVMLALSVARPDIDRWRKRRHRPNGAR